MRNLTEASRIIGAVITDLESPDEGGHPAEYSPIAADLDRVRLLLLAGADSIPQVLQGLRAARLTLDDTMNIDDLRYAAEMLLN